MAYGTVNADVIGTSVAGSNLGAGNASIMKNRIINGAMVISQYNGTSSGNNAGAYMIDRWYNNNSQSGKLTYQQNAGSVSTPVGFPNYLGITSASAYSVGSSDYFFMEQRIEGFNFADCNWGTANAKTVTLSFQVYSSLTGTFGGCIQNPALTRNYPFTYTISSANTWTTISVTVAVDTSGTWVGATNAASLYVTFSLGAGSTYTGTAGAWSGTTYVQGTSSTSVVGTNGATFYITGVQLEAGSTATPFEYRQYGTELSLCQRYYQKYTSANGAIFRGQGTITGNSNYWMPFAVVMRAAPTMSVGSPVYSNASGAGWANIGQDGSEIGLTISAGGGYAFIPWTATSEL